MVTIVYSFIRKKIGILRKFLLVTLKNLLSGLWGASQRRHIRNTSNHIQPLSSERINILNAINFMWTVVVEEAWMGMYQDLVDYSKKKNGGSTKIPFSYPEKSTTFLLGQNVNVYTS